MDGGMLDVVVVKPDVEDVELDYEVEQILDHAVDDQAQVKFKVKWLGYGDSESSWEPEVNLLNARSLVQEYYNGIQAWSSRGSNPERLDDSSDEESTQPHSANMLPFSHNGFRSLLAFLPASIRQTLFPHVPWHHAHHNGPSNVAVRRLAFVEIVRCQPARDGRISSNPVRARRARGSRVRSRNVGAAY